LAHTFGNVVLHLIFSTKARLPLILPHIRPDLFAYLGGIVRELHATALIINGTADHVHMLVRIRPMQSAAELARVIKANSSRWAPEVENGFCVADRIRCVQCQRVECCSRVEIHRDPRGTSSDEII
jgi:REP element-mobilizing transposase RayT